MISPFSKTIWLVFVMAFIIGGCEQKYKEDVEVLALGPALETLDVVPDYAAGATEAAGGPDAWMKTKELQLDCVVTLVFTSLSNIMRFTPGRTLSVFPAGSHPSWLSQAETGRASSSVNSRKGYLAYCMAAIELKVCRVR
jgi:hypothetical protein